VGGGKKVLLLFFTKCKESIKPFVISTFAVGRFLRFLLCRRQEEEKSGHLRFLRPLEEKKFPSGDRKPATRTFEMFTGLVGDMQRRLNTSSQVMTKR
jgi:hypothetical protein